MKTKRPTIDTGTTFPYFYGDRCVNAEVEDYVKNGSRKLWKVRLTESQQPIVREDGVLAGTNVEFQANSKSIADEIVRIESLPCFGPARAESDVVQWIDFGSNRGLWAEIREVFTYGKGRNTHWTKSEYGDVQSLLASGDAVRVNS